MTKSPSQQLLDGGPQLMAETLASLVERVERVEKQLWEPQPSDDKAPAVEPVSEPCKLPEGGVPASPLTEIQRWLDASSQTELRVSRMAPGRYLIIVEECDGAVDKEWLEGKTLEGAIGKLLALVRKEMGEPPRPDEGASAKAVAHGLAFSAEIGRCGERMRSATSEPVETEPSGNRVDSYCGKCGAKHEPQIDQEHRRLARQVKELEEALNATTFVAERRRDERKAAERERDAANARVKELEALVYTNEESYKRSIADVQGQLRDALTLTIGEKELVTMNAKLQSNLDAANARAERMGAVVEAARSFAETQGYGQWLGPKALALAPLREALEALDSARAQSSEQSNKGSNNTSNRNDSPARKS